EVHGDRGGAACAYEYELSGVAGAVRNLGKHDGRRRRLSNVRSRKCRQQKIAAAICQRSQCQRDERRTRSQVGDTGKPVGQAADELAHKCGCVSVRGKIQRRRSVSGAASVILKRLYRDVKWRSPRITE